MLTPRPARSPWILRYAHSGFSRASRPIRALMFRRIAGRPVLACADLAAQRRRTMPAHDRFMDPALGGLSVKVRAGRAREVEVYRGSPGILEVTGRAQGHIPSGQKWPFPSPLRQGSDDPAGWRPVGKTRRVARFCLADGRAVPAVPGLAGERGCAQNSPRSAWPAGPGGRSDLKRAPRRPVWQRTAVHRCAGVRSRHAERSGTRHRPLQVLRGVAGGTRRCRAEPRASPITGCNLS
jgi:hypothetical protein